MAEIPPGYVLEAGTDPAEDLLGPFYLKRAQAGFAAGFLPAAQHGNGMGNVHGGVLMTLADFALCAQARFGTADAHIVTVSLSVDFVAAAQVGYWINSDAQIVRRTGSLVFVQGCLMQNNAAVVRYSGIGKRIKAQA